LDGHSLARSIASLADLLCVDRRRAVALPGELTRPSPFPLQVSNKLILRKSESTILSGFRICSWKLSFDASSLPIDTNQAKKHLLSELPCRSKNRWHSAQKLPQ